MPKKKGKEQKLMVGEIRGKPCKREKSIKRARGGERGYDCEVTKEMR